MSLYHAPVWEEPPETAHRRRYEDVLGDLVSNVGHWARIGEYASSDSAYQAALNLRKRHYRIPYPEHDWDFVNKNQYVWAKYNGEQNTGE